MWEYVARKYQVPFLDLNPAMTALNVSLYPLDENGTTEHFNPDGHLFFSMVLAHALIQNSSIPWVPNTSSSPK
jgi:hypothetical protein